jgi:hypothetical protein
MSKTKIIREGEKFKSEHVLSVDGDEVTLTVKCSVDYMRLRYKVQPVITMTHGDSPEMLAAVSASVKECIKTCEDMLRQARESLGLGTQGNLFENGEPAGSEA